MTGRSWSELRAELVEAFGAFPFQRDEDTIRVAFERFPVAVRRSAGAIVTRHRAGKVRDGWRVLALEVGAPAPTSSSSSGPVPASAVSELEQQRRRARSWMRSAGRHYDRLEDVQAELQAGPLRSCPELMTELEAYWHELTTTRPAAGDPEEHPPGADPDRGGPSVATIQPEGVS